jgi:hypothetical protein
MLMGPLILTFLVVLGVLALIGRFADQRASCGDRDVTPGLALLPGDIKYESQDGRVKVYFPVVTSIVLSVVLTLVMRLFS